MWGSINSNLFDFTIVKGALNPNFLNLTKIEKIFGFRNVLVPFLNFLLLKSYKRSLPFPIHSKVLLRSGVIAEF